MVAKAVRLLDKLSDSPEVRHWVERAEEAQKFHQIDVHLAEERGRAEGKVEGQATAVLEVLRARGIDVNERERERILGCRDQELLRTWLTKAVTVQRAAELFES